MSLKAILFGSTGMVGEGVLHVCLEHPQVEHVLTINRRTNGIQHEKTTEILHRDFFDLSPLQDKLSGFDACFFCMGVSSVGMKEDVYRHITYDLTMGVARLLADKNPDMTFCYVSGTGTDSSAAGRSMWARVKGRTENELLDLFKKAYMFRPGYIQPIKGLKRTYKIYKLFAPFYPLYRLIFPKYVCTLEDLGRSMVSVCLHGDERKVLENRDITRIAAKP